jgi:hypothetical protein
MSSSESLIIFQVGIGEYRQPRQDVGDGRTGAAVQSDGAGFNIIKRICSSLTKGKISKRDVPFESVACTIKALGS